MSGALQRQRNTHSALVAVYEQHLDACSHIQRELLAAHPHATSYLRDSKTIFRYLRSSQFDSEAAARRVSDHLKWRSQENPGAHHLAQLPTELQQIITLHPEITDLCGRPAAFLRLRHVRRVQPGALGVQDLKTYLVHGLLEPLRERMSNLEAHEALQVALLIDLQNAGYANLVSPPCFF